MRKNKKHILFFFLSYCSVGLSGKTIDSCSQIKQYQLENFKIEAKSDSLYPTRRWIFPNYADGIFPCDSSQWPECIIKGFDTDGMERFYILGGYPAYLACYKGVQLEWERNLAISMKHSTSALFKLTGDSIYFVNDDTNTIYRIHKSGRGKLEHSPLCLEINDVFRSGRFRDNCYYIEARPQLPDSIPLYDDSHNIAYICHYPNKRIEVITANSIVRQLKRDATPRFPFLEEYSPKISHFYLNYFAQINGNIIYTGNMNYSMGDIVVVNTDSRKIIKYPIAGLPWLAPITGIDRYGECETVSTNIVVNNKMYCPGYDNNRMTFTIVEYDLNRICRP